MIRVEQTVRVVLLLQCGQPRQFLFRENRLERLIPVREANVDLQSIRTGRISDGGTHLLRQILDCGVGRHIVREDNSPSPRCMCERIETFDSAVRSDVDALRSNTY